MGWNRGIKDNRDDPKTKYGLHSLLMNRRKISQKNTTHKEGWFVELGKHIFPYLNMFNEFFGSVIALCFPLGGFAQEF